MRLQQQRAQQQMELQLRMRQQQERATRAAPDAATDPQRRQFEIEQQQRLQQFNDTQSRGAVMERPRSQGSEQAPNEQMRRFDRRRAVERHQRRRNAGQPDDVGAPAIGRDVLHLDEIQASRDGFFEPMHVRGHVVGEMR